MYLLHRKKNGIYANISLFLSDSEITIATQSSLYPDQMVTAVTWIQSVSRSDGGSAPRDDLYSPECQRRSGACTMMVDEQIQSYRISFELTKPNHSNLALFGTMKLIINFLCQLRLDPELLERVHMNV